MRFKQSIGTPSVLLYSVLVTLNTNFITRQELMQMLFYKPEEPIVFTNQDWVIITQAWRMILMNGKMTFGKLWQLTENNMSWKSPKMLKSNHNNHQKLNQKIINKLKENICLKTLHNSQISDSTSAKSNLKSFNSHKTTLTSKQKHRLNQNSVP